MYVDYDGTEYRVNFAYSEDKKGRRVTIAEVWEKLPSKTLEDAGVDEVLIADGRVTCSKEDNFDKVVGRKEALAVALQTFTRDFRTTVWNKYKATCKYIA